jgi:hypothetical protein
VSSIACEYPRCLRSLELQAVASFYSHLCGTQKQPYPAENRARCTVPGEHQQIFVKSWCSRAYRILSNLCHLQTGNALSLIGCKRLPQLSRVAFGLPLLQLAAGLFASFHFTWASSAATDYAVGGPGLGSAEGLPAQSRAYAVAGLESESSLANLSESFGQTKASTSPGDAW